MPEKDYYETLGVSQTASADDVRRSFRKLAKEYHPDANNGDKEAEKRFKEISSAYDVLSDPEKRSQYDQLRKAREMGFSGGADGSGGFDFSGFRTGARGGGGHSTVNFQDLGDLSDLFSDMFSSEPRHSANARRTYRPQKGEDLVFTVEVPFDLAVRGGKTSLSVPRNETCKRCSGSGAEPGASPATCPTCKGTGSVSVSQGTFGFSRPCPQCLGRGQMNSDPCHDCSGAGAVRHTRTLSVSVPRGVTDGAKIRLSGQGEAGIAGGPPGDLYLLVRVAAHPEFERKGNDIYSTITVDFVQAALGAKIPVNTLDGSLTLTIPPGTQPSAKLRLREKGVKPARGPRGHHYVSVNVSVPKNLNQRQKELLQEFSNIS